LQPKIHINAGDNSKELEFKRKQKRQFDKNLTTMFKRNVNPKNIVKSLNLEDKELMDDTQTSSLPEPSAVLELKPGVNLSENGKTIRGPVIQK